LIRDTLAGNQKFFFNFCLKFANVVIPRLVNNMHKCKGISQVGAEQVLKIRVADCVSVASVWVTFSTISVVDGHAVTTANFTGFAKRWSRH
jgi:hypothetical protein